MEHEIKIFGGEGSLELTKQIIKAYAKFDSNIKIGDKFYKTFSDKEFKANPNETVREKYVFIIQSTFMPLTNLFELFMMIGSAKGASAYKVVAVVPYYGFARQDRKDTKRAPITAQIIASFFKSLGLDRIITMDLHANQIEGFFPPIRVDHLYSSTLFIPYIESLGFDEVVIVSPDNGGGKRAEKFMNFLNERKKVKAKMVVCHKDNKHEDESLNKIIVLGDVKDKHTILVDDMIDSGGTIILAADAVMEAGAKSVRAMATHPVTSGKALENMNASKLEEVVFTDTIPIKGDLSVLCPKAKILSSAEMFADAIYSIANGKPFGKLFID